MAAAVRQQLHRALQRIRTQLQAEGLGGLGEVDACGDLDVEVVGLGYLTVKQMGWASGKGGVSGEGKASYLGGTRYGDVASAGD